MDLLVPADHPDLAAYSMGHFGLGPSMVPACSDSKVGGLLDLAVHPAHLVDHHPEHLDYYYFSYTDLGKLPSCDPLTHIENSGCNKELCLPNNCCTYSTFYYFGFSSFCSDSGFGFAAGVPWVQSRSSHFPENLEESSEENLENNSKSKNCYACNHLEIEQRGDCSWQPLMTVFH